MGGAVNHVTAIERAEPHPRADECRAQLNRILSSPDFESTDREHRFLAYIVEETLAGRGGRIKAYSIAVEVFGREQSFDAQNDPIVRIAAGHLRRALERYYLTAGRSDTIVITIPKGCYVPSFAFSDENAPAPSQEQPPASAPGPAAAVATGANTGRPIFFWRGMIAGLGAATLVVFAILFLMPAMTNPVPVAPEVPRVLVMKLEDLSQTTSSSTITNGLTQEIVTQLSKFRDIVVLQAAYGGAPLDPPPRFILAGSVELSDSDFHLRVRFVNQENGLVLWANTFDGPLSASQLVHAQAEIASNVASTLAQSYGIIFQADAKRSAPNPPDDWIAYSCTLSFYAYRADLDSKALPELRSCLEKAVARFPDYATAWALLAQTYLEEIRFRFPYDRDIVPADVEHALYTARHAIQLDPFNTRGMQAEMFALFFSKQFEAGKVVGDKAMLLNPNDTELMGEYGYRLAVSGDWNEGCPLIAEARQRNPGIFGYYESGLALCSYFKGNLEEALMWTRQAKLAKNPIYHLIAAATYSEAGLTDAARNEFAWLCENTPGLMKRVRQQVFQRLGKPADAERFLNSLKKTGLVSRDEIASCAPPAASISLK